MAVFLVLRKNDEFDMFCFCYLIFVRLFSLCSGAVHASLLICRAIHGQTQFFFGCIENKEKKLRL